MLLSGGRMTVEAQFFMSWNEKSTKSRVLLFGGYDSKIRNSRKKFKEFKKALKNITGKAFFHFRLGQNTMQLDNIYCVTN